MKKYFLCAALCVLISPLIVANPKRQTWEKSFFIWNFGLISSCDIGIPMGIPKNPEAFFAPNSHCIDEDYRNIKSGNSVWVQCRFIPYFCKEILPRLNVPIVLLVGDGDASFPSDYSKLLAGILQRQPANGNDGMGLHEEFTNDRREMPGPQAIEIQITEELAESAIANSRSIVSNIIHDLNTLPFDDLDRPKCMLLIGPAGTGKTTLGAAIAKRCNARYRYYRSTQIANQWQNSGDLNLVKIFENANEYDQPCVVAIDELQVFVDKTKNIQSPENTMLNTLWGQLDNFQKSKIFFIGMMNPVDEMPDTIITRFDPYIVRISLPNLEQRKKILEFWEQQQKHKVALSQEMQPAKLAAATEGFNCRDLAKTFNQACQIAFRENSLGKKSIQTKAMVKMEHFKEAMAMHQLAVQSAKKEQPSFFSRLGTNMADSFPRIIEGVLLKILGNAIDKGTEIVHNKVHGIDPYELQRDQQLICKYQKELNEIAKQQARCAAEETWNKEIRYVSGAILGGSEDERHVERDKLLKMLNIPTKPLRPSNKEKNKN